MGRIVDILRGSQSKVLAAYGAEDCPTYGTCRAETKLSVTSHVKALVSSGYLRVEGTAYPTLTVTLKGREVLQGLCTVVLVQATDYTSSGSVKKPCRSPAAFASALRFYRRIDSLLNALDNSALNWQRKRGSRRSSFFMTRR